ncbi:hypothetical protein BV378_22255 [Nostoc sp. RF31YmG]|nr:hypothetical protein BV378_22255 [Nostoc sp. RF31YmG]
MIPPDELTSWEQLADQVVALTQAEIAVSSRKSIYLWRKSFGACVLLKILMKFPNFSDRVILINSA